MKSQSREYKSLIHDSNKENSNFDITKNLHASPFVEQELFATPLKGKSFKSPISNSPSRRSSITSEKSYHSLGTPYHMDQITPVFKAVKPNPMAFKSTGFLSKRSKNVDLNSHHLNHQLNLGFAPETPKKSQGKLVLPFTPQFGYHSTIITPKPVEKVLASEKDHNLRKSRSMDMPLLAAKRKSVDLLDSYSPEHPSPTHMQTINNSFMNSSSPYDNAIQSPSSPIRKQASMKSFSSPNKMEECPLESSFIKDDEMEEEGEEFGMIPSLLFPLKDEILTDGSLNAEEHGTDAANRSFQYPNTVQWKSHAPHMLDREYFQICKEKNSWEMQSGKMMEEILSDYFFDTFEVIDTLGRGSFADVFKVKNKSTAGLSAIKKTRHPFQGMKDRIRKLQEVNHLWIVCPHQNIVEIYSSWEQYGCLYIETELCQMSLESMISSVADNEQHFTEDEIWNILRQIGSGLKHIHDSGLLHLDIKPANILYKDGLMKIADFGLSTSKTIDVDAEGDKYYIAPEVLQGNYGKAADVFSLGLIILEISANIIMPSQGDEWRKLRIGDMRLVPFDVQRSPALLHAMERMLNPDPQARAAISEIL